MSPLRRRKPSRGDPRRSSSDMDESGQRRRLALTRPCVARCRMSTACRPGVVSDSRVASKPVTRRRRAGGTSLRDGAGLEARERQPRQRRRLDGVPGGAAAGPRQRCRQPGWRCTAPDARGQARVRGLEDRVGDDGHHRRPWRGRMALADCAKRRRGRQVDDLVVRHEGRACARHRQGRERDVLQRAPRGDDCQPLATPAATEVIGDRVEQHAGERVAGRGHGGIGDGDAACRGGRRLFRARRAAFVEYHAASARRIRWRPVPGGSRCGRIAAHRPQPAPLGTSEDQSSTVSSSSSSPCTTVSGVASGRTSEA